MKAYIITFILMLGAILFFIKAYFASIKKQRHKFCRLLIWGTLFTVYSVINYLKYINIYFIFSSVIIFLLANYINDSMNNKH